MSSFSWVNFLLILGIIIYLIIITVVYSINTNNTNSSGVPLNIVYGTKTGSSDIYTMRGNYIYLAQSTQIQSRNGFILNINSDGSQAVGQVSYIKNTTNGNLTIRGSTATINIAGLNTTISNGQTAAFLATDTNGTWMRLE